MGRPKSTTTGKVSKLRQELDYLRGQAEQADQFNAAIARVVKVYEDVGSLRAAAKILCVSPRTLDRAIKEIPELALAMRSARLSR